MNIFKEKIILESETILLRPLLREDITFFKDIALNPGSLEILSD